VRVTGPLANPRYVVDLQSLATEVAKAALQREIERRLGGGKSGGQEGGAAGAIGDALRGLFGKPK
jgi:AsmA protein